jgi:hypothetical protein
MKKTDLAIAALPVIGGLNWGLVALGKFDLVAKLTGNDFGETNIASRAVYGLVGAASIYSLVQLTRRAPQAS